MGLDAEFVNISLFKSFPVYAGSKTRGSDKVGVSYLYLTICRNGVSFTILAGLVCPILVYGTNFRESGKLQREASHLRVDNFRADRHVRRASSASMKDKKIVTNTDLGKDPNSLVARRYSLTSPQGGSQNPSKIVDNFREAVSKNRASSASRSMDKNAVSSFVKFHPYSQRLTVLKEPGKVRVLAQDDEIELLKYSCKISSWKILFDDAHRTATGSKIKAQKGCQKKITARDGRMKNYRTAFQYGMKRILLADELEKRNKEIEKLNHTQTALQKRFESFEEEIKTLQGDIEYLQEDKQSSEVEIEKQQQEL
eukprot:449774-Hanusia_phi.AAC.1